MRRFAALLLVALFALPVRAIASPSGTNPPFSSFTPVQPAPVQYFAVADNLVHTITYSASQTFDSSVGANARRVIGVKNMNLAAQSNVNTTSSTVLAGACTPCTYTTAATINASQGLFVGEIVTVDTGGSAENVTVLTIPTATSFTANGLNAHSGTYPIVAFSSLTCWDSLTASGTVVINESPMGGSQRTYDPPGGQGIALSNGLTCQASNENGVGWLVLWQ